MNVPSDSLASYLNGLAQIRPYNLREQDLTYLEQHGLSEYIYNKVTSSEFRRSQVDAELTNVIMSAIQSHVDDNSPISFAIPFGAYKHWRAWSYPEPEWAEIFNVNYMLRYVAPIVAAYSPGVSLHYSYGDYVMDTVSNMPRADTDKYILGIKALLELFQARLKQNITIDAVRINDFYNSREEHSAELRMNYEDNVRNWTRKYSEDDRASIFARALRNLMPKGVEDLTALNKEQWHQRALMSAMWCDAHDSLSLRRGFNKRSGHIQLGNIKGRRLELHVGSCDTSVHQFWVGVGLIEVAGARYLQRILSQEHLNKLKAEKATDGRLKLTRINVETEFQQVASSYKSIYVLSNRM